MSAEFADTLGTKSFDDIVEDTLQSIVQKDIGLSNVNPGSVLRTLVEVLAENEDTLNYYMEYIYNNMNIDNCVGDELDRSVKILGLSREPSKPAIGMVTFYTGDAPAEYDIEIPYGYIVSTRPDIDGNVEEFYVSETGIIKSGEYSTTVAVTCNEPGFVYIPIGAIDVLPTSLQGVFSVKNEYAINGGRDTESDDEFRERIKSVRETFGKCTNDAIKAAVSEVAGVSDVNVIDMYDGLATTGVMVTTDTLPPPQLVKDNIEEVVNSVKASGIKPYIVYTQIKSVDISITINIEEPDTDIILDAINKYCNSLTSGQTFIIKQLEKNILNSILDNDYVDISTLLPTDNVTATTSEIIRPGTVTINGTEVSS